MVSARIQPLNVQHVFKGSYVLYILRCLRTKYSAAFSFASERANKSQVPLIALHLYVPEHHNVPQRVFLLEGLKELKESMGSLQVKLLCVKANDNKDALKIALQLCEGACEVVLDAAYLRGDREFEEQLNHMLIERCRKLTRIEGNVSVPINLSSKSAEWGARTLRPKIWQHLKAMLAEKWEDVPMIPCGNWAKLIKGNIPEMNLEEELKRAQSDCKSDSGFVGGETVAQRMLSFFISNKLVSYHPGRNIPGSKYQSLLSPYLHFGMISAIEIIKRVKDAKAPKHAIDSFIEELLVRRDLSHNFVYYAKDNYDSLDCLPDWAQKTLKQHKNDKRDYIYTSEELEDARTHDPYWNAAQLEMVHTNKMHGYMRMYWGKKVIEWTPDYETAYRFLIEQNDKHELDGRDPNGYTGVMWVFGMHDRAHAERAVFGKLRYMNAEGLYRKYKQTIGEYVRCNYKLAGRKIEGHVEPPKKKDQKPVPQKRTRREEEELSSEGEKQRASSSKSCETQHVGKKKKTEVDGSKPAKGKGEAKVSTKDGTEAKNKGRAKAKK
uniref:Deoxyribodipyrimidine photo-lyase n=1 Tax=Ascaris suum TaxID=6253 RepID=F1KXR8_ASCSU